MSGSTRKIGAEAYLEEIAGGSDHFGSLLRRSIIFTSPRLHGMTAISDSISDLNSDSDIARASINNKYRQFFNIPTL